MALAEYRVGDRTYQFEDHDVPAGAVPVVSAEKAVATPPANKNRKPTANK